MSDFPKVIREAMDEVFNAALELAAGIARKGIDPNFIADEILRHKK